jgi:hypothetical protein
VVRDGLALLLLAWFLVATAGGAGPAPPATVLGRDDAIYLVVHTAVDCPVCKVWRASESGLGLARHLGQKWPMVHLVLVDRHSLYANETESLYPANLRFLYERRRDNYALAPATPTFELIVADQVVFRRAGLQAWQADVLPALEQLENSRK